MSISKNIADIRRNYKLKSLDSNDVKLNPFEQFKIWFEEVLSAHLLEPTAFTLATADVKGKPSARVLLLKGYDDKGFIFYTNYEGRKGFELKNNNQAAMLFFYPELERQIRIEGTVEKVSSNESDKYFKSRPFKSKVGAWASSQSEVIESRWTIIKKFLFYLVKFHKCDIPLPPFWGGYRLLPESFEFWQGRASRLHDRVRYRFESGEWVIERLSP